MSYYAGDYYRGDYYRGDLWGKIGKGIRRLAKNVSKAAPIAVSFVPGLGGVVGRLATVQRKVKRAAAAVQAVGRADPIRAIAPSQTERSGTNRTKEETMTLENNRRWAQGGYRYDGLGRPVDADGREIPTSRSRAPRRKPRTRSTKRKKTTWRTTRRRSRSRTGSRSRR